MQRREVLKALCALAAQVCSPPLYAAAIAGIRSLGTPQPFDYAWLKGEARALAGAPYREPVSNLPEEVARLDWDQYQAIQFRDDHALWAHEDRPFLVKFFHLGLYFNIPVRIYSVVGGQAQEIAYDPRMFDFGKSGVQHARLPPALGFAGFRIHTRRDPKRDVAAFLGASYFRAVGGEMQYGMSARGLAVNTGMARPEEFPMFTQFWIEQPAPDARALTIYALLDSRSIAGAYRFDIRPDAPLVMDIDAALYPRAAIERLGIAPLTSMYDYGENDRRMANDWRPEIHDSDGLALWTGAGEWLWRPLVNPATLRFNAYADDNPRGFGLLQRDRDFDHYQDDGVFYERRPSVWVEPKSGWGKGSVQLVEIPSVDETSDNIVAFWNPAQTIERGEELLFSYRLYWGSKVPFSSPLAHVVATRTGIGGVVGKQREHFSWRFVVDFAGGGLAGLDRNVRVEPVISASRGVIEIPSARPLESVRGYRASFDLRPVGDSTVPYNLRLYLRAGNRALTETWIYQWALTDVQSAAQDAFTRR
jgi:periplasmic glucans biosynthesis protein